MKVTNSFGLSKVELFNLNSASVGYQDAVGKLISIKGAAIGEDFDPETDEIKKISAIVAADGTVYSGNSATVYENVDSLIDTLCDDPDLVKHVGCVIVSTKAKSGRDFCQITLKELPADMAALNVNGSAE